MTGGQCSQLMNKHACYYQTMSGKCKLSGKACTRWHKGEECDGYVHHAEAVRIRSIEPKLRELVKEAAAECKMVYVENDDPRFTREDLNRMMNCIILQHPSLSSYVDIDATRQGDYLVVVYQGVGRILVND